MNVDVRKGFHHDLDVVRDDIVRLAAMTTEAVATATQVLLDGDLGAADELIQADDVLDTLALEIEERCYQLLALQQPMATDLRALVTAIRMVAEIERSGDLAVNIVKAARRMYGVELDPKLRGLLARLGEESGRLFRLSIDAYVDRDAGLASALDDMDDTVDLLHHDYIASIFETHDAGSTGLQPAVQLALVGRYYERIADHAVNIGERVRYMVTGWLPEHTGVARLAAQERGDIPFEAEDGVAAEGTDTGENGRGMRILVTNDDGIGAPGILPLAMAVVAAGHDVVVAAPLIDMSGSGAAIGRVHEDETIDVKPVELAGLEGIQCIGVDGPPALAVMAARLGGFGEPPVLVVSGINPGPNTGRSVLHSGTVGAALTAANFGASGLAVSIGVGEQYHWGTAARFAITVLDWLTDQPATTVINLNVPNLPFDRVLGVRPATLAAFGTVRAAMVESDGGLQMELSAHGAELPPDSDTALVRDGYASITSLAGIQPAGSIDLAEIFEPQLLRRSA